MEENGQDFFPHQCPLHQEPQDIISHRPSPATQYLRWRHPSNRPAGEVECIHVPGNRGGAYRPEALGRAETSHCGDGAVIFPSQDINPGMPAITALPILSLTCIFFGRGASVSISHLPICEKKKKKKKKRQARRLRFTRLNESVHGRAPSSPAVAAQIPPLSLLQGHRKAMLRLWDWGGEVPGSLLPGLLPAKKTRGLAVGHERVCQD
jgi:hypothetical protein